MSAATIFVFILCMAVALPTFGFWYLFRKRRWRIWAAMVGGQIVVLPAVLYVGLKESAQRPLDPDPYNAAVAVIIISCLLSLLIATVLHWLLQDQSSS